MAQVLADAKIVSSAEIEVSNELTMELNSITIIMFHHITTNIVKKLTSANYVLEKVYIILKYQNYENFGNRNVTSSSSSFHSSTIFN